MISTSFFYWIQWSCVFLLISFASYQDLRERLVYDYVWIIGGILGTILNLIAIYLIHSYNWIDFLWNLGLGLILVGIFMFPKLFGGSYLMGPADLFGIITIAYMLPQHSFMFPYKNPILLQIPEIFNILVNTFIIFLLFMLGILFTNIILYFSKKDNILSSNTPKTWFSEFIQISGLQKFFYFCVGKRINVDNLPKFRFVKILEYNDEETHEWIPTFNLGFEDEYSHEEMVELVPELKDMDLKAIWISPMIPLMVVFLGGLLSSALFGNLFFRFLELFF